MKFTKTKKVIGGTAIGVIVLFSGANVYATSVLDTSLLQLISQTFNGVSSHFTQGAKEGVKNIAQRKKEDIGKFVDQRTEQALNELENQKNSEIKRAQNEIDGHYNQLIEETEAAFTNGTNTIKENMKTEVNTEIQKAKQSLTDELEKTIERKLNELKGNNGKGNGNKN